MGVLAKLMGKARLKYNWGESFFFRFSTVSQEGTISERPPAHQPL